MTDAPADRWAVHATTPTNELWTVHFRGKHVANIWLIVTLDHPDDARQRIADGLNRHHGPSQPSRCWRLDDQLHLRHNGRECGQWEWIHQPPSASTHVWTSLVLVGLNHVDARRGVFPPAPLPPN